MDRNHLTGPERESRVQAEPPSPRPAQGAETALLRLQRRVGNGAAAEVVQRLVVQRHAPGTALPDGDQLAADVGAALAAAQDQPVPAQDGGAAVAGPAGAGAAGTAGEGAATTAGEGAATTAPSQEALPAETGTAEQVAAAGREGRAYNAEVTAAGAGGRAMSLSAAQAILTGAFGDLHTIVPGSIQVLADRAATWAKYDEVCMAAGLTNPATGSAWASGDAQRRTPGLDGFAWGGVVYVNGQTRLVTATAHEMLHNNTASGFRGTVGEAINEGATEWLAKRALTAAGVTIAAGRSAYPTQVSIVERLAAFVGADTLTRAYFSGAAALVTAYETARGVAGSWAALKAACDSLNLSTVTPLLAPAPAPTGASGGTGG